MKQFITTILLCLFTATANASFNDCKHHLGKSGITPTKSKYELCYKLHAVKYNAKYHGPDYSVMVYDPLKENNTKRTDYWIIDDRLPAITQQNISKYPDGSVYDRGHLTPADLAYDEETMKSTFYYTNQAPQINSCNRGMWKHYEQSVKKGAIRQGKPVTIITGVKYQGEPAPDNAPSIPIYFWKLFITADGKEFAYILPNNKKDCSSGTTPISKQQLLSIIGSY